MRLLPENIIDIVGDHSSHSSCNYGARVERKDRIVAFYTREILTSTTVKHK